MTSNSELTVSARSVTKIFGQGDLAFQALAGVDFDVRRGEFVMLVGPSGSGKTTLLSILGGVLTPSSGTIEVLGESFHDRSPNELSEARLRKLGFVFQGHNLIRSLSTVDNVALPLELRGWPRRAAQTRALQLLANVGLGDKANALPAELSGGQAQRVAIARGLVGNPALLLADEPTAALDASNGRTISELMKRLSRQLGTAVVVVTHDNRIFDLADRIVHIEDGVIRSEEGRLAA